MVLRRGAAPAVRAKGPVPTAPGPNRATEPVPAAYPWLIPRLILLNDKVRLK